jgi:hypothetical protein
MENDERFESSISTLINDEQLEGKRIRPFFPYPAKRLAKKKQS